MRLGKRIGLLIRAKLTRRRQDRTETVLRRADKMEALLEQLEGRLRRALARRAQLETQLRQAEEMARQWDRRADEALRAGDEAAAREAIRHKLAYTQLASELQSFVAQQADASDELQTDLTELQSRLTSVRPRTPRPPSQTVEPVKSSAPSESATEEAAQSASPGDKDAASLEGLRERMSRVWSDEEIENELNAIKNRLSAESSTHTKN